MTDSSGNFLLTFSVLPVEYVLEVTKVHRAWSALLWCLPHVAAHAQVTHGCLFV